jgi:hypothetical protein
LKTEQDHASLPGRFGTMSLEDPSSTSESEAESVTYTYINNRTRLEKLSAHFTTLTTTPNPWQKPHVYISCEGRDLGYTGGRLALVQIGFKEDIYLLDVLTYAKGLDVLKEIVENKDVEKVVWDGRRISSELFHGNQITFQGIVDLQLMNVYEKMDERQVATRGFLSLQDLGTAFSELDEKTQNETTINVKHLTKRISPCRV